MITKDKHLGWLITLLLIKAFAISLLILFGKIGLSPDEAQYWTWSQALDFGYYSKPPGIAWGIFLGTSLFQNSEFGVRFFALIMGFLIPIATYFLALTCQLQKTTAFFAGLLMAFTPIGLAASLLATTDGGMVLFWILALIAMMRGINNEKGPNYLALGVIIASGALFKWPIYLFWIFPLLMRRFWSPSLLMGVLISLLGLLPSLIWNVKHDFATFKHVSSTIAPQGTSESNFFEFLGAQAALVSPIIFILFILSLNFYFKRKYEIPKALQFCILSSLVILIPFTMAAAFKKMQGNWAVFAYPAAFVFLSYVMLEKKAYGKKWMKIGLGLSIVLSVAVALIPLMQIQGAPIPYRFNAFRHQMGWNHLAEVLQEAGYDPSSDFLFGDKYQMSSILSFYSEGQKPAYFLNLQGIRHNQFSYWKQMKEDEMHKTGYFVVTENSPHLERNPEKLILDYQARLSPFFKEVQFLGVKPLFLVSEKTVKGAFIFKCIDYNGLEPKESTLF